MDRIPSTLDIIVCCVYNTLDRQMLYYNSDLEHLEWNKALQPQCKLAFTKVLLQELTQTNLENIRNFANSFEMIAISDDNKRQSHLTCSSNSHAMNSDQFHHFVRSHPIILDLCERISWKTISTALALIGRLSCESLYMAGKSTRIEELIRWCQMLFDCPLKQGISVNYWVKCSGTWNQIFQELQRRQSRQWSVTPIWMDDPCKVVDTTPSQLQTPETTYDEECSKDSEIKMNKSKKITYTVNTGAVFGLSTVQAIPTFQDIMA